MSKNWKVVNLGETGGSDSLADETITANKTPNANQSINA